MSRVGKEDCASPLTTLFGAKGNIMAAAGQGQPIVVAPALVPAVAVPGQQDTVEDQVKDLKVMAEEMTDIIALAFGNDTTEVPLKAVFENICRRTLEPGVGMTEQRKRRLAQNLGVNPRLLNQWYHEFMRANPRYYNHASRKLPRARQFKLVMDGLKAKTIKVPQADARTVRKNSVFDRAARDKVLCTGNSKKTRSKRPLPIDLNNFDVANFILNQNNKNDAAFNGGMEKRRMG